MIFDVLDNVNILTSLRMCMIALTLFSLVVSMLILFTDAFYWCLLFSVLVVFFNLKRKRKRKSKKNKLKNKDLYGAGTFSHYENIEVNEDTV